MQTRTVIVAAPVLAILAFLLVLGIGRVVSRTAQKNNPDNAQGGEFMPIEVQSRSFRPQGTIPQEYTCDGSNISPHISWKGLPETTRSVAVIANDPDAPRGTFTHWLVFNIPPDTDELPENLPGGETLRNGAQQGENDFGKIGYSGPCPPQGTHRYFFNVFALDTDLGLPAGVTQQEVYDAMQGHIIASGELMGRYRKQK